MSELISGKEAWIALYDGFDIQIRLKDAKRGWLTIKHDSLTLSDIKSEHYEFRFKPRTITINGVELNQCYSVAIDYTKNEVKVEFKNRNDAEALHDVISKLYGFK